jgi:hypothetical protein
MASIRESTPGEVGPLAVPGNHLRDTPLGLKPGGFSAQRAG